MRKKKNQILAVWLGVVMLISMLPVTAFANIGENDEGETLRLSSGWYGADDPTYRYTIQVEYNGQKYVMGEQTEKGRKAVPVSRVLPNGNEYEVNAKDVTLFRAESGESVTVGTSSFTPFYLIEENGDSETELYLTEKDELLTTASEPKLYWSTSWYDRWITGYWKSDIIHFAGYNAYNTRIVLRTDDGEPYFATATYNDETHLSVGMATVVCSHGHMEFVPEKPATCKTNGTIAYYHCLDCNGKYMDEDGYTKCGENLESLAYGAKDGNGDGYCDDCGKAMPVFTKVTDEKEIVLGNKYLLVSEIDGRYYAMMPMISDEKGKGSDTTLLPATEVEIGEDAAVGFQNVQDLGAFQMQPGLALECSDLDQGEIRYELRGMVDGVSKCLADQFGSFWMDEYAKYGYRLRLNTDGTARVDSVYSESWDEATENGYFRAYKMISGEEEKYVFSILQESEYNGEGKTYEGATLNQYPVYLYRLTETGKVGEVSYTINDASTVNYDNFISENLIIPVAQMSNVSGMSEALTQSAIDSFVSSTGLENDIRMDVNVNITVSEYVSAAEGGSQGASVTFSLTPYMQYGSGDIPACEVPDSSFDGISRMMVTLYVGEIYPQQIIHHKQDGTKEYFYEEWSKEVQEQGANPFSVSPDGKGGWFATFYITEFSEITLHEIPVAEDSPLTCSITLGSDITVNVYSTMADTKVRFTMNGNVETVDGTPVGDTGKYGYRFEGVAPQLMGDAIKVELMSGEEVLYTKENFSVKAYCEAILEKTYEDLGISEEKFAAMKTLIYNLLQYGDAAQTYTGYAGTILTDVAGYAPDTIGEGYIGSTAEKSIGASSDTNHAFTGANVLYDNVNRIVLRIATSDISKIGVKVDDTIYTYAEHPASFKQSGAEYYFYSGGISALQFDKDYQIQLLVEGETVQTIMYSVNAYFRAKQDQMESEALTNMAKLCRAAYVYGVSAKTYAAK